MHFLPWLQPSQWPNTISWYKEWHSNRAGRFGTFQGRTRPPYPLLLLSLRSPNNSTSCICWIFLLRKTTTKRNTLTTWLSMSISPWTFWRLGADTLLVPARNLSLLQTPTFHLVWPQDASGTRNELAFATNGVRNRLRSIRSFKPRPLRGFATLTSARKMWVMCKWLSTYRGRWRGGRAGT